MPLPCKPLPCKPLPCKLRSAGFLLLPLLFARILVAQSAAADLILLHGTSLLWMPGILSLRPSRSAKA